MKVELRQSSIDLYDECISVVEREIAAIKTKGVTDAQLENYGSYCVPDKYADLVKGIVFPPLPFRKDADDDMSSVASSVTATRRNSSRRGAEGNDDDDAESVDTLSLIHI